MKKLIVMLILCLGFQSCIKCYKEKDYSLEKGNIEEKVEINGIDDLYIIGSELSLHINEKIISKELYLKNIKIYYKENFLGIIEINTKLIDVSSDKEYTSNGDLIKRINLREKLIKILEKEEKKLKINEDYMSEELTFMYEFYDAYNDQKIIKNINYRLVKHEKGCRKWIPNI